MSDGQKSPLDTVHLLALNAALRAENENLKAVVETLRRALYGARSERQLEQAGQLPLALNDLSAAPVEPAKLPRPANSNRPARPRAVRNIGGLPAHLPRVHVTIEPARLACPCCEGQLHRIGEDVSEMLDVVPAILRVRCIHRPRYGCRACESPVVQAKAPARPVDGGMPTVDLLAHVAVMKFAWHLPLHRQVKMLAGQGVDLDVSTLVHWISRAAWWLKPLHALLAATILAAPKIFCDDTPLPVLDKTRKRTRIARLWSYAMDDRPWCGPAPPAVVYLYAEDRKGRHVDEHLAGFNGVLQVDAYAGYNRLTKHSRRGGPVRLAFCLAHARRKFFEVHKATGCLVSGEALERIAAIYAIEARIRGTSAEERLEVRQAESQALFDAFKPWLMDRLSEISTKSPLAKAIRYTLGHWNGLGAFLTDGRVEVDSNTVERTIRAISLGKKNSLFAGSPVGGENWAILASLINTAKLHDLDPQTYLADVLERIVSGQTKVNALAELLPWNWKAARAAQDVKVAA
ncbi:IS66 family transposase [Acidocella sp.]|uniref:IS66 family transposase n=1 Tax=Acidocella sp. TaxID=50710 RepID=UPI0017D465CD|nr:IS66 family transposase [Acidocella sp.]NNM56427.1 IS66 family transposase [Acidocella sp.]